MAAHHAAVQSKSIEATIAILGHWIPGSTGSGADGSLGPYAGKETVGLFVWLASWAGLHFLWRKKNIDLTKMLVIFGVILVVTTLLFLHPIADPIASTIVHSWLGYSRP